MKIRHRDIVLITGAHGFLGQHVLRTFLDETHCDLIVTARDEKLLFDDVADEPQVLAYQKLDVTERNEVKEAIALYKPDVIVHCAGLVDVDRCEHDRELAWKTNVRSVEHIIEAARKTDARMVHISSDYVFDGTRTPYAENAVPSPLNYYGRTKLASENALRSSGVNHCILRGAFFYGVEVHRKPSFAINVIKALTRNETFEAFTDLYAPPTLVDDIALAVIRAVEYKKNGIYHIAGPEMISRYEFAKRIATAFHLNPELVIPIPFVASETRADRPRHSSFVTLKAQTELGLRITGIDEGLQVMLRGIHDMEDERQIVYQ
ncbi:MAG: SDR family oxidoreductase [Bacteroidota bacterium]|nr:SDR family oxidoreductase [Bacteroidota bacterium]MDP4231070.1 SDR family oxidoreductase [Bacteroidota bacterium]MDP4235629.1 SDR family oxidoreductase [Bacteroidota bacterium]